jgi:hypothetical protein
VWGHDLGQQPFQEQVPMGPFPILALVWVVVTLQ